MLAEKLNRPIASRTIYSHLIRGKGRAAKPLVDIPLRFGIKQKKKSPVSHTSSLGVELLLLAGKHFFRSLTLFEFPR